MAIEIHFDAVDCAPIDSATVMVLRDGARGLEVLMVRRHGDSGVLGGVHVFPGGKLDEQDSEAALPGLDHDAGWFAQALAEPGLAPVVARGLFASALRETREECALALPADSLWPWSRWITPRQPSVTRKRFDTRFFVAVAPPDQEAVHDDFEATEVVWVPPAEGLQRYWAGEIDLAPPQIMSLVQLVRIRDVVGALDLARQRPPALIEPQPFDDHGERVICYPGDPAHPVREPVWIGPTRLRYRNRRFEPEGGLAALLGD
ncbi:NUDIX hydrolase [Hydrogenophaga pseudoflava]|uniref:NUDIX domain protein n=1 Tax=Hydrogenophaga pseudoflava TaxID=47421 RepID=A0A4P6X5F4_HYDPS|nr:NUDIX hydrolase [Hydrogenophaga pseudoflava]QBM29768.1 NUDIX domain protein [Hydrogenophaga pseudoflava]